MSVTPASAKTCLWRSVVWLMLCSLCNPVASQSGQLQAMKQHGRQRRYLIYPPNGSKVQLIMGTGVPVPLPNQSVTVGWVIKGAYLVPTNYTEIANPYISFQKRSSSRRANRFDFYRAFENAAHSFGGGGKGCMLRAICEAAKTPLQATGLMGQLLHLFLTPSTTNEPLTQRGHLEYHSAERMGRTEASCQALYPDCKITLLELMTIKM